jgi:signal transduction histidine kinase
MIEPKPRTPGHVLPAELIHDLRTPLNQIIGYSEMLIELARETGSDGFNPDLQRIRAAGGVMLALVNDNLQAVVTVDSGPTLSVPPPEYQPVEIDDGPSGAALEEAAAADTTQRFILVVDDNAANRDTLARRLQRQGYVVVAAASGRQALEILRADTCDLVLLDIMMPEMDGYEVLQRIKGDPRLQAIPVVMISALSELDSVARCIEMGADDYLTKPFNPILLKARVGACLERKWARDREAQLFEQVKTNYKRLKALEALRDDMTQMLIHDLRTPLSSVIAGMHTLDVVGELTESQRELMDIAITGAEGLLDIINDMMDVENAESGVMTLEYTVFSAEDLVTSALGQVGSLVESREMTLVRRVAPDLQPIEGDEGKLRRTLVNLLGNAIKFTPTGGLITLDVRDEGSSALFSVSDNGEGIPSEAFDRVFEKFGRIKPLHGGQKVGAGLGLAFCKMVVNGHGGRIWVESTLGQGSAFHFCIPFSPPIGL